MPEDNIVALRPYVIAVDVSLELHLIAMKVTLCFGPFNSPVAASRWCSEFASERKQIEAREHLEDEEAESQTGVSTQPFLRAYVEEADILQVDGKMRTRGGLIKPNAATVDAAEIHKYALYAFQEAVTEALRFLDDSKDRA